LTFRTFETSDQDTQSVKLPPMLHPCMQRSAYTPQYHTRRHPSDHAISSSQSCTQRLQRNEERKEESYRRVEVALLESDIRGKVCRLCISYLPTILSVYVQRYCSPEFTYVRLIQRIEQKQHRQKRQQKTVKLQQRPHMHSRIHEIRSLDLVRRHRACGSCSCGELEGLGHIRGCQARGAASPD
jgi:hypothetical protein